MSTDGIRPAQASPAPQRIESKPKEVTKSEPSEESQPREEPERRTIAEA